METESMPLIDRENQQYIDGQCPLPAGQNEILFNIAVDTGKSTLDKVLIQAGKDNPKNTWDRIPTNVMLPMLGCVLVCLSFGACVGSGLIMGISEGMVFYEDFPFLTMMLIICFVAVGTGYYFGLALYVARREWNAIMSELRALFERMATVRQFAEGRIIEMETLHPDAGYQAILYSFPYGADGVKVTGEYITFSNQDCAVGDEVTVLYLDQDVHVLL
ncbi:MAG: hypothetical protein GYB65_02365 [Chloroflexi bacterium]|nr:hypothetical protein [Chloroflexota bacterium]